MPHIFAISSRKCKVCNLPKSFMLGLILILLPCRCNVCLGETTPTSALNFLPSTNATTTLSKPALVLLLQWLRPTFTVFHSQVTLSSLPTPTGSFACISMRSCYLPFPSHIFIYPYLVPCVLFFLLPRTY
ncbi:hypothetical protein B0H13DRAFT_2008593 [Mycena leptocephala]|nr:hypothetical protein B0H13DRAFT_2008593 [Mycena leptocephala]